MKRMGSVLAGMFLIGGAAFAQETNASEGRRPEVVRFGSDYTLGAGEIVRELVIIGGRATIHGEVERDAVVIGGPAELSETGAVGGEFVVIGGRATIASGATVGGDLVVFGGGLESPPDFLPGGEMVVADTMFGGEFMPAWMERFVPWVARGPLMGRLIVPDLLWMWGVVGVFLAVFLGLNFLLDAPVRACIQPLAGKPATTFLMGLLVLALAGPVSLVLTVSVFGLAIVPFVWAALAAGGLMGSIAVSRWFGDMILPPAASDDRVHGARSLLIGFAIVCLAFMVPILGLVSWAGLGVLGLGAAATAAAQRLRRENPAPVPPPPPPSAPAAETPASEPLSEDPPPVDAAAFPRATFLSRTGAFVLDFILVALIYGLVGLDAGRWFVALLLAYHIGLWVWKGATVGGLIAGVRVVRVDGRPLTFADALVRGLSSIFSAAVLGLGFFWILKDPDRQSWHDKIAGTAVVTVPRNGSRF